MFQKTDTIIMKTVKYLSFCSGAFMAIMAVMATVNVVTQKVFTWSIPSANDWITYLLIGVVYCSLAYVRLGDGLVRVDLLSRRYPQVVKTILDILCDVLGIVIFGLITVYSWPLFTQAMTKHELSSTGSGAFPLWPFRLCIVFFSALMVVAQVWGIVRIIHGIKNKDSQKEGIESVNDGEVKS